VRKECFYTGRYNKQNKSLSILKRLIAYNIGISGGCTSKCPSLNRGTVGGWGWIFTLGEKENFVNILQKQSVKFYRVQ
jgi:hypothetical protein